MATAEATAGAGSVRELGAKLAGKKPSHPLPQPKKPFFIRDVAQEQTLARWRREGVVVEVTTVAGRIDGCKIIDVGVFTLRLQNETKDILLFKTGIVGVQGPKALPTEVNKPPEEGANERDQV